MKKVIIIQRISGNYRVPFYNKLNDALAAKNISLDVIYGQPEVNERIDKPVKCIPAHIIKNKYIHFLERSMLLQPVWSHAKQADMIIIQQGNRCLATYFLIPYAKLFSKKIAIWGNCKQELSYYPEKQIKKNLWWKLAAKVDHWFAYNDLTKKIVCSMGYPEDKITSVQNSIDTKAERQIYESISDAELAELRLQHGIGTENPVGIFCSRLYADKRLPFLMEAVSKIRERVKDFHFFVVGDGVEAGIVKDFAKENEDWFHWVGSQYGKNKIKYFKLARFQLLPGTVGLHIIDSFAFETPIITTKSTSHGVEVDYLVNGKNGFMTANNLKDYVTAAVNVATNLELRKRLFAGCRESARKYTIENMVLNFAGGIIKTI